MGDPPLCSQPPPSAKPAARSERGMSLVEQRLHSEPRAGRQSGHDVTWDKAFSLHFLTFGMGILMPSS